MASPTAVNSQITDAVTQSNVKVLAEAPAVALGSLYQAVAQALANAAHNATTTQQNANTVANAAVAKAVADAVAQTERATEAAMAVMRSTGAGGDALFDQRMPVMRRLMATISAPIELLKGMPSTVSGNISTLTDPSSRRGEEVSKCPFSSAMLTLIEVSPRG